jgi:hypothetical protein
MRRFCPGSHTVWKELRGVCVHIEPRSLFVLYTSRLYFCVAAVNSMALVDQLVNVV